MDLAFSCDCGALRGHLKDSSSKTGTRIVCHCGQCRRAQLYFEQPDPAPQGVDLFQTSADRVIFDQGQEHLSVMRLPNTKLLRWYADCCKTPMFNVVGVPRMAFASIQSQRLDDPSVLGRIKSEGFVRKADGRQVHKGMGHLLTGLLSRAAAANLTGTWRKSPFFGEDGKPAKPIKQLTKEDVAHLS